MQNNMHLEKSRLTSFKLKSISAAVLSMMVVVHASAAGLGKLTVLSGLGQPLRAEIELTAVSQEEARTLQPKLASLDAFRQANIDFVPTLYSLRFAIEQRGTRQLIRITSTEVMSEPFVDVLLELNGANGRLVREYTFLLDPPELRASQAPQVVPVYPPEVVPSETLRRTPMPSSAESIERQPRPAVQSTRESPRVQVARERQTADTKTHVTKPATSEYQVKSGDSLSKIATRVKPEGVSLDQMLVGLYRANPDAFVGSNMNRLRSGQILAIPNTDTVNTVGNAAAHGIVVAQAADFNDYRNKLAGQVASSTAQKSGDNRQSATGKIAAKVEEKPSATKDALDKLKLSKADSAAAGKAASAQEEKIAREKTAADSAARVKDLEKNVSELQRLLEIKNKDLADRQKQADTGKAQTPPSVADNVAASKAAVADAKSASVATPPVVKPPAVTPPAATASSASKANAPAGPVVPATPAVPAVSTPAATAVVPAPVVPVPVVMPAAAVAPVTKPATVTPPVVKPAPVKPTDEPVEVDSPLGNPLVQGGVALLALLLGGFAFYRSRGKKTAKNFQDTNIPDSSLKANSLFGSTGGQSVDTNNSVFNSSFAPSPQTLDTNEVDPVAEADVYIAYGRDAQAEEILKEALRTQPERHPVRVKLLEIYAARKDTRAFESVATELYSMTKGDGDEWAQAAGMGIVLDPDNPLYANGKASATIPGPTSVLLGDDASADDNAELASLLDEVSAIEPVAGMPLSSTTVVPGGTEAQSHGEKSVESPTITGPADSEADKPAVDLMVSKEENDTAALSALDFDFLKSNTIQTPVPVPPTSDPVTITDFNIGHEEFSINAPSDGAQDKKEPDGALLVEHLHDDENKLHRPDPMAFDLSGITLDLPEPQVHVAGEDDAFVPTPAEPMVGGVISNNAEMATKLDLAVAYQEIGDKDGARELLDEVVKGGTPDQAEKAKSILARLG